MEDVLDVVNPLLQKYNLLLTGNVPKEPMTHVGKFGATTEVMVEWSLVDLDSDSNGLGPAHIIIYRVPGAGTDEQGKGIYRALTGSRKYACVFIFNLKFGDEPEEVTGAKGSESGSVRNDQPSVS